MIISPIIKINPKGEPEGFTIAFTLPLNPDKNVWKKFHGRLDRTKIVALCSDCQGWEEVPAEAWPEFEQARSLALKALSGMGKNAKNN